MVHTVLYNEMQSYYSKIFYFLEFWLLEQLVRKSQEQEILLLFKMFIELLQYYFMTQSQWVH